MSRRKKSTSTPAPPAVTFAVHRGDCTTDLVPLCPPEDRARLIIVDPPYNYHQKYSGGVTDHRSRAEYLDWAKQWLTACHDCLAYDGSLFLFAPDEWVSRLDVLCSDTFKLHRRGWIVWYYTFGVSSAKNFARSHTHILYFVKRRKNFVFNDTAIRVPSARMAVYDDARQNPKGKVPDNTWVLHRSQLEPLFAPDSDTWLESRICGTFHERQEYSPNQLPVPILERIILACSNPGDLVLDPMLGTGSTGVAAVRHKRRFLGMDLSEVCVEAARARVAAEAASTAS